MITRQGKEQIYFPCYCETCISLFYQSIKKIILLDRFILYTMSCAIKRKKGRGLSGFYNLIDMAPEKWPIFFC